MKKIYAILICLAVLAAAVGGTLYWYNSTYIRFDEETLRRDTTELTLTGETLPELELLQQLTLLTKLDVRSMELTFEEYDVLKAGLPNCRILWKVPFQGKYLSEDTQKLTVQTLSYEDLKAIPYLPALKTVHAEGCRDYEVLAALREAYPALEVFYTVPVGGTEYSIDTVSITVKNAEAAEVRTALKYLPKLEEITFTGTAPDNETIYQMMCDYPDARFIWALTLFGKEMENTITELDLSGIKMKDTGEIESYLKYFPNLTKVEMCDCGIPSEEMDAMGKRWPNIRFIWTVRVGLATLRTDAIGFMPWKHGHRGGNPLRDKDCKELKYCIDLICLDLGHMKVSDISFLQYMPKMKYLIVGELPCSDFTPIRYCKELIYLEIFNVTFQHQEILLELTKLQDLNMGSTKIYGTGVLKQMTWLKRLWIAGTGLTYAEYDELVAALPNTQVVMHIPHSTAGGWRDHQNYRDMRDILGVFYLE